MKKFALLTMAAALLFAACDDNDNSKPQNEKETAVDFNKFCDVVMGKACGLELTDADLNSCVETYKAEAKKYEATCKDVGEKYYKCVSNATINDCTGKDDCECIDDDVCKTEIDAYSACMGEPAKEEIDFNKFCNVVMGKACGANISEADINSCVETYKAEAKKYEATC
ncbi:MAG: hypothetical protein IJU23_14265, partial [Proteobacteria bacterium]|nr:hypothetical protein [Pseudomonadota bacterium]